MQTPELYEKIARLIKSNQAFVVCTITATGGSTPRKSGAKMIVLEDGKGIGSIGGGKLESLVYEEAKVVLQGKVAVVKSYSLDEDAGMLCGGNTEVFFEPYTGRSKLLIFGAGHVGSALASRAVSTGFHVDIIDDRPEMADFQSQSHGNFHCMDYSKAIQEFQTDKSTFVVIVTHGHNKDAMILEALIGRDTAYLGMIGSRRKVAAIRKDFIENKKASSEQLDKVDMPIGLDIGAETPEEIAISILAALIKSRNPVIKK